MKTPICIFVFSLICLVSAAEDYSIFKENGKVGLKNQAGQVLIPAQYEALGWSDGSFSVHDKVTGYLSKGLWGLINLSDHKITKAEYTMLVPTDGFLLEASKKIKNSVRAAVGCINTAGKEIIPFEYDGIKIFSLRAIVFNRSGNLFKYGLIDLENKKLIPLEYKEIKSIGSLRYSVENFQNKIALYTEAGRQITDFSIDSISLFYKNHAVIFQNNLRGLIDRDGVLKLQPTFKSLEIQPDGTVRALQLNECFFLDGQNKLIKKVLCDSIEVLEKNIYKITVAGQVSIVNEQLQPICNLTFSWLGKFKKEHAVFKVGNNFGLLRKNGTVAIEPNFDALVIDDNVIIGNQRQNKTNQWHIYDSLGFKLHTKAYDRIDTFNGKFYTVKYHKYWGALNENGKEIIACVYDSIIQSHATNVVVKFHNQYGIINLYENWLVTPQPNALQIVDENTYLEFAGRNTFLKSTSGNIIYFTENKIKVFADHLVEYLPSGKVWHIDLQGRVTMPPIDIADNKSIEKIMDEHEGLRAVKKDGKFGFIDSRGRLRIANRYEDAHNFSEQLAPIKILGKWGFINHDDKIAIQPVYDEVTSFKNGVAVVKLKNAYGVIDKAGKVVLPVRYPKLQVLQNNRMIVTLDGLQGLVDYNGKQLIAPKFNKLEDSNNGYVIVERNKKYSVLTLQGISTIPMIYDRLVYDAFAGYYIALKKAEWFTVKL